MANQVLMRSMQNITLIRSTKIISLVALKRELIDNADVACQRHNGGVQEKEFS